MTQDVTVTITGTNDAPTITSSAAAASGGVTEDAATPTLTTGGTLAIQDLDLIDTHTASFAFKSSASSAHLPGFTDGTTNIGSFTIDPTVTESNSDADNGATLGWHFSLNDNDPVLQSLAAGQTITQVYTVTFKDNHNATVTQDVSVTINGANDAPVVISKPAAARGAVTEDSTTLTLTTGGTLVIQDLDLIDTHTATAGFKSSASSAHLPGFTEGSTHIGTFTIDPTVTESSSDTDNAATLGWHFTLADTDPTLQSLAVGQTLTQVYTVTFKDNHNATVTQDVTVTINGANDAPTIVSSAAAAKGTATEDDSLTLTVAGTLAIEDLDLIDTHTATAAFKSSTSSAHPAGFSDGTQLGAFTIDPAVAELATDTDNGATLGWHFSLANSNSVLQSLGEGQTITEVYTVTFTDNHNASVTQDVTVTIVGVNDKPTLSAVDAGTLTDTIATDTFANLTGQLSGADVDSGETATLVYAVAGADTHGQVAGHYGTLTVGTDGSYSYVPDAAAINALPAGSFVDTFTVQTTDVHGASGTATLTVHVTGANDAPTMSAVTTGPLVDTAAADSFSNITGTLVGTDADTGETATLTYAVLNADSHGTTAGLYGSLTVNADGSYTYVPDAAAINALPQGSYSDHFTVQVTDVHGASTTASYTVDLTGANDAPTLSALNIGTLTDTAAADTFGNLTGYLTGTDADTGDTLTYAVLNADSHGTATGHYGTLTVNADGSYTYVPNAAAINALSEGAFTDTFTVQTTDAHGASGTATLTVDLIGADDDTGPVIDTEHLYVEHIIENSSDIVHGLAVVDADAMPGDNFIVNVSTAHPGLSEAYFDPASGSLDQINVGFETGIVYHPTAGSADPEASPPDQDMVTLTVTDTTTGLFDTVNFIFNEAGDTSQGITLQGTSGKDVIFATEASDTLSGGGGKDQFVFAPAASQDVIQHTVSDFETGIEKIDLRQFSGINSLNDLDPIEQNGDTLLKLDDHETILLKNVSVANLHAGDFLFGSNLIN